MPVYTYIPDNGTLFQVEGDPDTGITQDASSPNTLSLQAGGVEALRIEEAAGDVSVQILSEPTATYTFDEVSSTSDVVLKVGVSQARGGIVTKHKDGEVGNGTLHIGCYDESGAIIFRVIDKEVDIGGPVSLSSGTNVGTFNIFNGDPAFRVGIDNGNRDFPLLIQRNDQDPDPGVLIGMDVRTATDSSAATRAGDISHRWGDSAAASFAAIFDLAANDVNGRRVAVSYGADGTGPIIGFLGATAVAQQSTTGTTTGFTAGSGTSVNDDSTFTGNSGTAAYTIGDIVLALKNYGLLAGS